MRSADYPQLPNCRPNCIMYKVMEANLFKYCAMLAVSHIKDGRKISEYCNKYCVQANSSIPNCFPLSPVLLELLLHQITVAEIKSWGIFASYVKSKLG